MRGVLLACLLAISCDALTVDPEDPDSVRDASRIIARDLVAWYNGDEPGQIPGLLPQPYYWWAAGAMFGTLVDYWYYTGDDTYNEITTQALLFQVGENQAFMPQNQTASLGNDDQAFWGLTAMAAAEQNYPDPPEDQPQWLALAQAVFNTQVPRWNLDNTCGGGLKWQIFPFNNGYNYKNSISNGCFFNLAARLGMYTGNSTYFEWANTAYDWTAAIGLINPSYYAIFDGANDLENCTESSFDRIQWTYNAGIYLHGAAVMWNQTTGSEQAVWEERVWGIFNRTVSSFFYQDTGIMFEAACEFADRAPNCNVDQTTFKAYLARWLTSTAKVAPFTATILEPLMAASAIAAAGSCTGGETGTQCGMKWFQYGNDGNIPLGVGQQMNALEIIQTRLASFVAGPVTNNTGGTSLGDPNAGTTVEIDPTGHYVHISTADRAGAWILTVMMVGFFVGGGWFMISAG